MNICMITDVSEFESCGEAIGSMANILPKQILPADTERHTFLQCRLDANFGEVVWIGHLGRHV